MDVLEWLLDSDPSIRWQVMRDLTDEPADAVEAERSKVATEGWGADLLSRQGPNGQWFNVFDVLPIDSRPPEGELPDPESRKILREVAGLELAEIAGYLDIEPETLTRWENGEPDHEDERLSRYKSFINWTFGMGTYNPKWISTTYTLLELRDMGIDPTNDRVRKALALVRDNVKWDHDGEDFFDGEVEPCINGMTVAIGAYFGQEVDGIIDRLLTETMSDGGWNCEQENGSTRSSFDSTLSVLEGLLEYEKAKGDVAEVTKARHGGEEYLLERNLLRRLSTGEIVDSHYTEFSYPPRWHYDVLRSLDYFRSVGGSPDPRCSEAIELVESKRQPDGRWLLEDSFDGRVHFEMENGDGQPSRWNTLRALRTLAWAGR